jgi:glycogen debranching enzyme GlgX
MNRFAASEKFGASINEFKLLVKALHQNGIKVILDVVFNHTNEGDITGPVTSFKGIDPKIYYILDSEGKLLNFTGCGNTFNCNHPVTQKLIIDTLRYWVLEMHVDGFRFDLASIFLRDTYGNPMPTTPIIEAISKDPILSNKILIAEPWDAVGLYQVGHFYKNNRWSEWNGRYRDTVRRFIKGTLNNKGKFATRLSGSQDLYGNKGPSTSINFITAHDGFSLCDLVSYNDKHNLANGEYNRDGQNENDSWNCGVEGETDDTSILTLRERQMKNFHLTLLLSQGIPMLNMGDEYGHTKRGNNNTWCQDNALNWFLWNKINENGSFHRFYKQMIFFRKEYPSLRLGRFLTEEDIKWYGSNGQTTVWDQESQFLAFILNDSIAKKRIYCAWNAQNTSLQVEIPSSSSKWSLVAYTANVAPDDFYEKEHRPLLENTFFEMAAYSALILISDL